MTRHVLYVTCHLINRGRRSTSPKEGAMPTATPTLVTVPCFSGAPRDERQLAPLKAAYPVRTMRLPEGTRRRRALHRLPRRAGRGTLELCTRRRLVRRRHQPHSRAATANRTARTDPVRRVRRQPPPALEEHCRPRLALRPRIGLPQRHAALPRPQPRLEVRPRCRGSAHPRRLPPVVHREHPGRLLQRTGRQRHLFRRARPARQGQRSHAAHHPGR